MFTGTRVGNFIISSAHSTAFPRVPTSSSPTCPCHWKLRLIFSEESTSIRVATSVKSSLLARITRYPPNPIRSSDSQHPPAQPANQPNLSSSRQEESLPYVTNEKLC